MTTTKAADATLAADAPIVHIRAVRGLVPLNLREVWEYRDLIFFFFWRDVKGRYRQMAFGPLWIVLGPLMNMVVFTLVFGVIAKLPTSGIPCALFNYSGLLPWAFFSSTLFASANSLLAYRDVIAKIYFPRLVAPVGSLLAAFVDFGLSFLILEGMMLHYGYLPSWSLLAVPLYLLLAGITGMAVGLWAASWVMHYRDVSDILGYVTKFWMFLTPVVLDIGHMIPAKWLTLYRLNPMTNVVEGFRWALLGTGQPSFKMLCVSFLVVIPILISGAYYFRRTERSIVDVA